ncbi:MAG: phage shock protein A, partial [Planctomycetaceae bacterium]
RFLKNDSRRLSPAGETVTLFNYSADISIQQARHKRTLLLARLARAESTDRINNAIDRAGSSSAFAQFSRLEERVDRAEAMSEAHDRLDGRDPAAEELATRFEADERRAKLQSEFEALKQQLAVQES